ncbi:FAD-dependent oxidoreductase [Hydrogenophaga sp. YM1]|jgi:3-(3-hydroxy-phenyl)propionate hydroxylase|uniref:FAD-dependent oxidoreductase n=2 Tax=Comamonadaceae TaxID=80864 RepID=UPI0008693AC0|nr:MULTISPECIES: FAD-dependent oxidoreductase [unclassified Hydrogenophaga]MBN9369670.1 FAD-dependent oxidoreductase [Hydrogenophaga sp.]ODT32502.1 MAG: FAD-binding monooxygenase [Hydrogenophaga sp. SCN 70-13]QRR33257.1 FAD-dependent oxidoreductase [Hydrogenophaga sp. YM1]
MSLNTYRDVAHTNGYEFTQGGGYELPTYPFVPPPELHSQAPARHPIVIVGGGITGLTLACSLARLGVKAILIDEDDTVGVKGASSRGICYTQKSLEIFERLGVYEPIAAKGTQWSVGRTFAGDDEVYSFDLRQQGSFNLSQQPPFINIQQFYIEAFLVDRIQQLGHVELRWRNRLTAFEQNEQLATLTVETPAGSYRIEAEHVIDATGSNSPLRKWLQVPFDSKRGDDRWCIADVRFSTRPPTERHTWIEAPFNENRAVWQHLMADDVWRIDYQMAPNADPAHVSREDVVRERLARQFGPEVEVEIVWVGPYAYRSECVHHMRHGRVYFMGDSAKVVSPFGARGGNTGVADADNLAWKLAAVLRGQAAPGLLDSYEDERLEAARENVRVTNRTARFLRPAEGIERVYRDAAIALAKRHPFARALVNTGRMAVANPYTQSRIVQYAPGSAAGQSVQNVAFRWANGQAGRMNQLLDWAGGELLLLCFGALDAPALRRLREVLATTPLRAVQVPAGRAPAQASEHVRDPQGHLRGACGLAEGDEPAWALVRPDGYLAASGGAIDGRLVQAIGLTLGLTGVHA